MARADGWRPGRRLHPADDERTDGRPPDPVRSRDRGQRAVGGSYFGLKLTDSTVSAADLKAYYAARGVPEPFLTYLKGAADGTNPFVYIKGSTVTLVDAAKHDILSTDVDMTVPDDFPLGTYTVQGKIRDVAGNETTVTLILMVAGTAWRRC